MRGLLLIVLLSFKALAGELFANYEVVAINSVFLSLPSSAEIEKITVKEGDIVEAGKLLVQLDLSQDLLAINIAKTKQKQAQLGLEEAQAVHKRLLGIKEQIDERSLEAANFAQKRAKLLLEEATLGVKSLENALKLKQLKAPFSGLILNLNVQEKAFYLATTPILKLQGLKKELHIYFDESAQIKPGASFIYELNGQKQEAKIEQIIPAINAQTRKIKAKAKAPDFALPRSFGEGKIVF